MSTSAEPVPAPHHTTFAEAEAKRHWIDQAARTTAVLAVLAAVSSGQYANQFSHTILAQAEASDQWSYYQAKSIKRHLVNAQIETLTALARTSPQAAADLEKLQAGVVLCTIASSSKRKELWAVAIALGVLGLAVVGYGFLIGLHPPA